MYPLLEFLANTSLLPCKANTYNLAYLIPPYIKFSAIYSIVLNEAIYDNGTKINIINLFTINFIKNTLPKGYMLNYTIRCSFIFILSFLFQSFQ